MSIDQARSDRETQQQLRDNEAQGKKLKKSIQAMGVGLTAGGIAASSGSDTTFANLQNHHIPVFKGVGGSILLKSYSSKVAIAPKPYYS